VARLERRLDEAYGELRGEVARDFARVEDGLRRRLSVYRAEVHLDQSRSPSFAAAAADVLHRHAAKLGQRLGRVTDAGDVEGAHRARISAKRVRYLADPLEQLVQLVAASRGRSAPPGGLAHRLKGLQDLLGELHDAHVMEAELGDALEEAAAERARRLLELALATPVPTAAPAPAAPAASSDADARRLLQAERRRGHEPGLLALARLNRERRDRLFGQVVERWQEGGGGAEALRQAAEELEATLRAAADEAAAAAG